MRAEGGTGVFVGFRLFAAAIGAIVICPHSCRWPKIGLKTGVFDGYNGCGLPQPAGGAICVSFGVLSTEGVVPEQLRKNFGGRIWGYFLGKMRGIKLRRFGVVGELPQAVAHQAVAPALVDGRMDGEWSCSEVD